MGVVIILTAVVAITAVTISIKRDGPLSQTRTTAGHKAWRPSSFVTSGPSNDLSAHLHPRRTLTKWVLVGGGATAFLLALVVTVGFLTSSAVLPNTAAPDALTQTQAILAANQRAMEANLAAHAAYLASETDRIRDSSVWYQGTLIWRDDDSGKYRTAFSGKSFRTLAEAKAQVDQIQVERERYMAQLSAEIAEFDKEIARLQEETDRILQEMGYSSSVLRTDASAQRLDPGARPSEQFFRKADLNGDGKLDWGEIKEFQAVVYRKFPYRANAKVLSPDEFIEAGGGDCDDFAAFSASLLKSYGYEAYVLTLAEGEGDAEHAVAGLFIGEETYREGCLQVESATLFNPRTGLSTGVAAPNGNYVILDYWKVGTPVESFDSLEHVADVSDAIGSSW